MSARCLPTCKYGGVKFVPDARNRDRRLICGRSDCRAAASRAKKLRPDLNPRRWIDSHNNEKSPNGDTFLWTHE